MILLDIKRYIKQHHEVSLEDIQNHFDLTEDTVRGIMTPLINQGHIQVLDSASCSTGKCSSGCSQANGNERYLWRDKCFTSLSIPVQVI
ncbi:FeoC-like transcriptional regulator [Thiomicrorhabdus sp. ZW0627]|uniref:FeoC-like transcriptional regulator n=1 Tax=Thiomicrorhabdus sp. ZW0627 TaxID=3039774 RepID=UPI002436A42B|nr:FeoC-like transcriptional regulator [Thiomicrorhabdus sp. ZW0627]MDG6773792.1 FeoC-like transcriptional regulator [Thiomicrorhabdus sp. ZW0627]